MTYQQHPQPRPSNPARAFAWAAVGLVVLGVLLGVGGASVAKDPCKPEQKAYIESTYATGTNRPSHERVYRQCQKSAKTTSTTLVTLSVFSLLGAAGCGAVAYTASPTIRERKRQQAWARYYAAQQASQPPTPPAASTTAPVEDYETYESAPAEEPTAPAPEPEPEIPWYMKGDK